MPINTQPFNNALEANHSLTQALSAPTPDLSTIRQQDYRLKAAASHYIVDALEVKSPLQVELLAGSLSALEDDRGQLLDNWYAKPAHYAAWSGDVNMLNALKTDLTTTTRLNLNIAHYAGWSGNPEMLEWVKEKAPVLLNERDNYGRTIAHYTALSGNVHALKWVAENAPTLLSIKDSYNLSIAHYAAKSGNPALLQWIQEYRINDGSLMSFLGIYDTLPGLTLAFSVAAAGHIPVLEWIKRNHPDVFKLEPKVGNGATLAHYAINSGELDVLCWVAEFPFKMDGTDRDGMNIAHYAIREKIATPQLQWIKTYHPLLLKMNSGQEIVLIKWAIQSGCIESLDTVLAMGFDLQKEKNRQLLLETIIEKAQIGFIEHLISNYGLLYHDLAFKLSSLSIEDRLLKIVKPSQITKYYHSYLTSITVDEVLSGIELPSVIKNIVLGYTDAADKHSNWSEVELKIEQRNKMLSPLSNYTNQQTCENRSRKVLNTLMARDKLTRTAWLAELDDFLISEINQPYYPALLECRLNTMSLTNTPLPLEHKEIGVHFTDRFKRDQQTYKNSIEQLKRWQTSHNAFLKEMSELVNTEKRLKEGLQTIQDLKQISLQTIQASHRFHLKCWVTLASISFGLVCSLGITLFCLSASLPGLILAGAVAFPLLIGGLFTVLGVIKGFQSTYKPLDEEKIGDRFESIAQYMDDDASPDRWNPSLSVINAEAAVSMDNFTALRQAQQEIEPKLDSLKSNFIKQDHIIQQATLLNSKLSEELQSIHLQNTNQEQRASYSLQLSFLNVFLGAPSVIILALGIAILCLPASVQLLACGAALVAVSSLSTSLSAYSFFVNRQTRSELTPYFRQEAPAL